MVKKLIVFALASIGTLLGDIPVGEGCFVNKNFESSLQKITMKLPVPDFLDYEIYKEVDTGLIYAFFTFKEKILFDEFFCTVLGQSIDNNDALIAQEETEDGSLLSFNTEEYKKTYKNCPFDLQILRIWQKGDKVGLLTILTTQEMKAHTEEVLNTFTFS